MDKKDYKAFEKVMASLNELYGDPGKKVSDLKMELYYNALKGMSVEQLNDAVNVMCQTKTIKTWPLPAEIIQAIEGNPQDKAQVAFDKLIGAIRHIGPYQTVIFDDPAIHAIVGREGGWEQICDKTIEEMKFFRADFIKSYPGYATRAANSDVPLRLIGIHDAVNRCKGIDHKIPPVIVGDQQKALEWTERRAISKGKTPALVGGSNA